MLSLDWAGRHNVFQNWDRKGSSLSLKMDAADSEMDIFGRLRFSVLFSRLEETRGKAILDIGCGNGWFCYAALAAGASRVVGIDLNRESLELANNARKAGTIDVVFSGATRLPFESGSFDVVVAWEVIEHVPPGTETTLLSEINRVLKPTGRAFLSTPNDSLLAIATDPAAWLIGHRHYSTTGVAKLAGDAGLSLRRTVVKGGLVQMVLAFNLYISKWVFHRGIVFKERFAEASNREYNRGTGFFTIFAEFRPHPDSSEEARSAG